MKTTALSTLRLWVSAAGIAACLLMMPSPATAQEGPESPFVGEWCNQDFDTGGVTRIHIRQAGGQLMVQMWGRCHPKECDWGEVAAVPGERGPDSLAVTWKKTFKITNQKLILEGGVLRMEDSTIFTDQSGRQPRKSMGLYVKGLKHDWNDAAANDKRDREKLEAAMKEAREKAKEKKAKE